MATSSFSGPVKSAAGFIEGTDAYGTVVSDSTLAVTDALNGQITPISRAAGTAITLPASSGSQARYRFFLRAAVTSNTTTVKVANATDVMVGSASIGGGSGNIFSTLPASDTITLNGSTTGGLAGSYIECVDVSTGYWVVSCALIGSGTPATPFSATVS